MEIVLMRHGRPAVDLAQRSSAAGFRELMAAYDVAKLDCLLAPPADAAKLASQCNVVVCSDLSRSLESAQVLGMSEIHLRHEMFREILMPHGRLSYPRLSMVSWIVIFRLLQVLGYSTGAESLAAATQRSARCAARLIELAAEQSRVLLVGHGVLNYLIARRLTQLGWIGTGLRRQPYWGFIRFKRP